MTFLSRLEKHFGRFAIPGLIRYVAVLNALSVILIALNPGYEEVLKLNPAAVYAGQWWRVLSFIFVPESATPLFAFFQILLMWFLGDGLERVWGTFRLNIFYFSGAVAVTIAALFFGSEGANFFLNTSLFFAFATLFPEVRILVLFVIPMKMKWVAWIIFGMLLLGLLASPLSAWIAAAVSLSNYLLFFGPSFLRGQVHASQVLMRRQKFERTSKPDDDFLYKCTVCGRTDKDHPELEFRVGSDGRDYCKEHRTTGKSDSSTQEG